MKAYEVVVEHIEQAILSGHYPVGSALPPERELSLRLGVSRAATREGIRSLQAQGVLESVVGAGKTAGTRVTDQHTEALTRLVKLHVALGKFPVDDVIETRVMLERESVTLAAQDATSTQLDQIAALLATMESTLTLETFNQLDTRFHVELARIGHNQLITDLTQAVREALLKPILDASVRMSDGWYVFRDQLVRQHSYVFDLIAAHRSNAAADAMEEHIRTSYSILGMQSPTQPAPATTMSLH